MIKWQGIDKLDRYLEGASDDARQAAAGALYREAERIMTLSQQRFVPVRDGILKGSGHVKLPEVTRNRVSVTLGYGGAAAAYALIQHEEEDFKHKVGGPKYLERPVKAAHREVSKAVGDAIKRALS